MQKLQRTITWTILASETSHVFCCLIPAVLSLISVFSSIGLMGIVPGFVLDWHDFMHHWEPEVIAFSGVLLIAGWLLHRYSKTLGCAAHNGQCKHESCLKKQRRTDVILIIAALLFAMNVILYLGVHKNAPLPHAEHHHEASSTQ